MTSIVQTLANRANATHSTGPVTEAGKAISSLNATTHGLTSKKLVLAHEDLPKFEALRAGFLKSHAPANEFEIACVERITTTYWRVERTSAVETALWDQLIASIGGDSPAESMATAFTDDAISKKLKLFMRYQAAITRDYNKALADLRHAQADRKAREKAQAQASAEAFEASYTEGMTAVQRDGFDSYKALAESPAAFANHMDSLLNQAKAGIRK